MGKVIIGKIGGVNNWAKLRLVLTFTLLTSFCAYQQAVAGPLIHSSANLGTKYGTWGTTFDCSTCHARGNSNVKRVAQTITTPTGARNVIFTRMTASSAVIQGGFGDDQRTYAQNASTNICEVCHHKTTYHQYSSTKVGLNLTHNNRTDCMICHPHSAGFKAGSCVDCHSQQQGAGTRQVVGTDTALGSHHIVAATINAASCGVCHEQTTFGHQQAGDVAVGIYNQDTGAVLTYNGTTATAANLEASCASCHDVNGASRLGANALKPFADSGDTTAPPNITWPVGAAAHRASMACFNCHGKSGATGTTLDPKYNGHGSATADILQYNYNAANTVTAAANFCYNCHGTTPTNGALDPIQKEFNYNGSRHNSITCGDCHQHHQAKAGNHTVGTNLASGVLNGAAGARLTTNPAFWTAPAAGNFTATTLVSGTDLQATLCFKCHTVYKSGYNATSPSGAFAMTDVAKEFNPNNVGNFAGSWTSGKTAGGFHPVLATAGSNLGAIKLASLVTTNFAWSQTVRNTMTCADCHGSATTTDPLGPHGSAAKFILRGPNTTWNNTLTLGSSIPAGTFCLNCHASTFTNSRFTQHNRSDHFVPCFNCHAAIPHGGPRPGMLVSGAGAGTNVGGVIAGWDQTSPYWQGGTTRRLYLISYPANNTTAWAKSNCGCNGTGH